MAENDRKLRDLEERERELKEQAKKFGMADVPFDDKKYDDRNDHYKNDTYDNRRDGNHDYRDDNRDRRRSREKSTDRSRGRSRDRSGSKRSEPPKKSRKYDDEKKKDDLKYKNESNYKDKSKYEDESRFKDSKYSKKYSKYDEKPKRFDDLPDLPPSKQKKYAENKRDESPDIIEVKEISKPNRKISKEKDLRRRSRSRSPKKSEKSRSEKSRGESRERYRRPRSRSPQKHDKPGFRSILEDNSRHYLQRESERDRSPEPRSGPNVIRGKKSNPNDFFNDELKAAITAGRLKMTEKELLVDGPNYSHTTNGKEEQYQKCRIFVGHLPVDFLSKDDIYYIFDKYGKILAISLHKGFSFIQFKNPEMAELAATSENGRRVKGACLEVNLATISKEEARKLPREGATQQPIHRATPQCRLYLETEMERMYACQIERKLRALGITVDTTIWKETSRKSRYHGLDDHLLEMQTDPDSICAIQIGRDDVKNKTATVHIFKNDLEEHRNMPIVEALILVQNRVEKLRKHDEPPPGRIGSIMRIIADGRMATLLEVEQVIEWLEQRRIKLGGKARKYESDASTEKLKSTISQLFPTGGVTGVTRDHQPQSHSQPPLQMAPSIDPLNRPPAGGSRFQHDIGILPPARVQYAEQNPQYGGSQIGGPSQRTNPQPNDYYDRNRGPPPPQQPNYDDSRYRRNDTQYDSRGAPPPAPPSNGYQSSAAQASRSHDDYTRQPSHTDRAYQPENNVVYGSTGRNNGGRTYASKDDYSAQGNYY